MIKEQIMTSNDPMESVRYRNSIDSAVNLLTSLGAQRDALGNCKDRQRYLPRAWC